jgi:hypothetical protein
MSDSLAQKHSCCIGTSAPRVALQETRSKASLQAKS